MRGIGQPPPWQPASRSIGGRLSAQWQQLAAGGPEALAGLVQALRPRDCLMGSFGDRGRRDEVVQFLLMVHAADRDPLSRKAKRRRPARWRLG